MFTLNPSFWSETRWEIFNWSRIFLRGNFPRLNSLSYFCEFGIWDATWIISLESKGVIGFKLNSLFIVPLTIEKL